MITSRNGKAPIWGSWGLCKAGIGYADVGLLDTAEIPAALDDVKKYSTAATGC